MYGTVTRFKLKPGMEDKLRQFDEEMDSLHLPGFVATFSFRMDNNPQEYYEAVVFESKKAYRALADSPEQDARFRKFRALLEADPEWHDGEIVLSHVAAKKATA